MWLVWKLIEIMQKNPKTLNAATSTYFTIFWVSKVTRGPLKDMNNDNRFWVLSAIDFIFFASLLLYPCPPATELSKPEKYLDLWAKSSALINHCFFFEIRRATPVYTICVSGFRKINVSFVTRTACIQNGVVIQQDCESEILLSFCFKQGHTIYNQFMGAR